MGLGWADKEVGRVNGPSGSVTGAGGGAGVSGGGVGSTRGGMTLVHVTHEAVEHIGEVV